MQREAWVLARDVIGAVAGLSAVVLGVISKYYQDDWPWVWYLAIALMIISAVATGMAIRNHYLRYKLAKRQKKLAPHK